MVERRGRTSNPAAGPPPSAGAVPVSIPLAWSLPPPCAMSVPVAVLALPATAGVLEEPRQKKRKTKKHREQAEATAASSESPRPPATPESKRESTVPVAPETLTSATVAAAAESPRLPTNSESKSESPVPVAPETPTTPAAVRLVKERERKDQVPPPASPLIEEPVRKEEKKRKKRKHGEAAVLIPPPPTPAAARSLQMESNVKAEGATVRKKQRRRKVEQEQSGQPPFPGDVRPQGRQEAAAAGGVRGSQCVKRSSSKKSWVLKKQQPLPHGFSPPEANPNSIGQDPNYSKPYGAFFAQFTYKFGYKSDRWRDGNGSPLPNSVDHPVRLPPQGHTSSASSLLTAKETSKAARTATSNTKQPCPASGSQEETRIKGKEKPENKVTREMAVREFPCPPANPEYKSDSPAPVTPVTLSSAQMMPAAVRQVKETERKNQEALPASPLMEEPASKEEKKHKKTKNGEATVMIPSPPTAAVAQILQMESKVTAHRRQKVDDEQSGQPPFPIDVHPQSGEEAAGGCGVMGSQCVKRSSSKKSQVLKKQQPLPQGFFPPMANPNSIDQDPNHSSPFGAFFAQFAYKPDRWRDGDGPPLPNTSDRPARLPPRGHQSSESSLLTAKQTSKAARTTTSYTKQPCPASASTSGSQKEARIKEKQKPENKMAREMAVRESPRPPANPAYKSDSPVLVTPETLSSAKMMPAAVRQVKEREMKNQEVLSASPLMEEPVWKEEKKHKKRKNGEAAVMIPSPPTAVVAQILQMESKVTTEGATVRKKHRRQKVEHDQSGQPPFPIHVHPQAGEEAAAGGVMGSQCIKRRSSKKSQVLKKQQPLPQGFFPPMANPNSIDQDPNYSSPFGAFFAQFAYKSDRRQDGNGPPFPNTADRPARLPPRGHPSSGSSLLTAKQASKAARTTTSNTKRPCPASASTSGSQERARVKGKEKPEKMARKKKPRKSPSLSASEKRSDKYRRLPLDQLVSPPSSPHQLLQEKYASDPWKVIVICMLLNLTQGVQVRKKVEGFFKRYPDPQTAYTADPEKMAEYLAPLGLQRVKTNNIQKFSKAYVGEEWTYITELCGVGKYAADAYAIFCAGRATEVIPQDHKLVDYWNYVCKLAPIQKSQDVQEAGVMELENVVAKVQEVAVSC